MILVVNESEHRIELRDGARLLLSFSWSKERSQYMTDRGELLGADWNDARRKAEQIAVERSKKGKA